MLHKHQQNVRAESDYLKSLQEQLKINSFPVALVPQLGINVTEPERACRKVKKALNMKPLSVRIKISCLTD